MISYTTKRSVLVLGVRFNLMARLSNDLPYIIVNKHTHPHDYHDYPHNVPLINNLLHNNNTRDYNLLFQFYNTINSGYCDYYKLTP